MATRTLTVKLVGDAKNLTNAFDKVGGKAKRLGSSIGKVAIGAGALFAGAAAAAVPLINAASDLNEEMSKADQVFGDAAGGVKAFAEGAAESAGLSEQAALAFGNSFGQLGKAAGLGGDQLGGFSTDLLQLAADLASFNNISVEEAAQKLQAGLAGETEPLERLGVFFNAAQVEAKALEMGLVDASGAVSDQNKILARNALIMEQTVDAQGDFARTSDGLANKQRILSAKFQNLQAQLGEKLLPIALRVGEAFLKLVDVLGPVLLPIFDKVGSAINTLIEAFQFNGLKGAAGVAKGQAKGLLDGLVGMLQKFGPVILKQLGEWAKAFFSWVADAIPPLMEKLNGLISRLTGWIQKDGLTPILEKLLEWGQAFIEWVAPMIPPLLIELGKLQLAITEWIITEMLPMLGRKLWALAVLGFQKFRKGAEDAWENSIKPWLKDLPGNIHDTLSALPGIMFGIGLQAVGRLLDGIKALWPIVRDWLHNAARSAAQAVWEGFKDAVLPGGAGEQLEELIGQGSSGGGGGTSPRSFRPEGGSRGLGLGMGGGMSTNQTITITPEIYLDSALLAQGVATGSQKVGGVPIKLRAVR